MVYEQVLETGRRNGQYEAFTRRRVTIELFEPTVDGATQIHLITSLPAEIDSLQVAELYLNRWTIEV